MAQRFMDQHNPSEWTQNEINYRNTEQCEEKDRSVINGLENEGKFAIPFENAREEDN